MSECCTGNLGHCPDTYLDLYSPRCPHVPVMVEWLLKGNDLSICLNKSETGMTASVLKQDPNT